MQLSFPRALLPLAIAQAVGAISGIAPSAPAFAVNTEIPDAAVQVPAGRDLWRERIELQKAVLENPDDADLRHRLGKLNLTLGDHERAAKELDRAIELGRDDYKTWLDLGEAWVALGQYQRPFTDYELLQAETPAERAGLLTLQGQARMAEGQLDDALELFESALDANPGYVPALLRVVEARISQEELGSAELALVELQQASGVDLADVLRLKAKLAFARDRYDEAAALYRQAADARRGDPALVRGLAEAQLNAGKLSEAQATLKRALRRNPDDPRAVMLSAMAAFEARDYTKAAGLAQRLTGGLSPHPLPLYIAGASSYYLGEYQQAREFLSRYVAARPGDAAGRQLLGSALLEIEAPAEAYAVLRPLAEDPGEDKTLLALLGIAATLSGDASNGVTFLDRAVSLAPEDDALRAQLAAARLAVGDRKEGLAELQRLAQGGGSARLNRQLAGDYMVHGELDQALDAIRAERVEEVGNVASAAMEAVVLMEMGDFDAAQTVLDKAAATAPDDDIDLLLARAELERRRGDADAARALLERIVADRPDAYQPRLQLALLDAGSGRKQRALDVLTALIRDYPAADQARVAAANLLGSQQRWQEAEAVLKEAPDPENVDIATTLGLLHLAAERPGRSLQILEDTVSSFPGAVEARLALARAYRETGALPSAYEQIDAAADIAPESDAMQMERARLVLADLGSSGERLETAARDLSGLQKTRHGDPGVWQLTALWAVRKGEFDQAVSLLQSAADALHSTDSTILLGDTLFLAGRQEEAVDKLKQWVTIHPDDNRARLRLGGYRLRQGQFGAAADELEAVWQRGAGGPDLEPMLALALVKAERIDAAEPVARMAYEAQPKNPLALQALGLVRLVQGNASGAVNLLKDAMAQGQAPSLGLRLDYAQALAASGRRGEARRLLQDLLSDPRVSRPDKELVREVMQGLSG